ncbi:hypothetical protein [uncultured Kiloniella sp.]|uniref:hypothetical protein n=1 Tax=uncultured Kiloniella sp. TaxID=1133091 RepID=UPI00262884FF|nr:hypothetical protein [uncultured Kiloniella sp.]
MSKRVTVTEADMRRALRASIKSGLTVNECVMTSSEVRIIYASDGEQEVKLVKEAKPKDW